MPKTLTPMDEWMVKSNLQTIANGTPASEIIAILRAGGYYKVASAVEKVVNAEEFEVA